MEQNINVVPNIITGKDLDYLSDIFSWNYEGVKKSNEAIGQVNDLEEKELFQKAFNAFNKNLNVVLEILRGGSNE